MSTNTPSNPSAPLFTDGGLTNSNDVAMTVDVMVHSGVLDAVSLRLPMVRVEERKKHGRTTTNLSTLCEQILLTWQPGQTKTTRLKAVATCKHCGRTVATHSNGKLRVHGVPRCPDQYAPGGGEIPTRPLRFPMNKAQYERIRDLIRANKESVTSVLTQRLAHFARYGTL